MSLFLTLKGHPFKDIWSIMKGGLFLHHSDIFSFTGPSNVEILGALYHDHTHNLAMIATMDTNVSYLLCTV